MRLFEEVTRNICHPIRETKLYFQQVTYVNGKCSVCWQLHLQSKMGILRKLIQMYCGNSERNWTVVYKSVYTESTYFFDIPMTVFLPNVLHRHLY